MSDDWPHNGPMETIPTFCPFCAGIKLRVRQITANGGGPSYFHVECESCWATGPIADQQRDCGVDGHPLPNRQLADLAVERWNARTVQGIIKP